MGKIPTILSSFLIFMGLTRLVLPEATYSFVAIDWPVALFVLALGTITFFYEYSALNSVDLSSIFQALGVTLGGFVLLSLYTPTLGNLRDSYISLGDLLLLAESAAVCGLASFRTHPAAAPFSTYFSFAWLLLTAPLQRRLTIASTKSTYRGKLAH